MIVLIMSDLTSLSCFPVTLEGLVTLDTYGRLRAGHGPWQGDALVVSSSW